jgi:hypothetical protein
VATFSTKKVKKFKKIKLTFILDSLQQNLVIKQISSRGFLLWHHQEAHQISQKCPLLRREQRAEKKGILQSYDKKTSMKKRVVMWGSLGT